MERSRTPVRFAAGFASVDDWMRAACVVVADDGDDAPHPASATNTTRAAMTRTCPRVGSVVW
jgi:hypothetical protein